MPMNEQESLLVLSVEDATSAPPPAAPSSAGRAFRCAAGLAAVGGLLLVAAAAVGSAARQHPFPDATEAVNTSEGTVSLAEAASHDHRLSAYWDVGDCGPAGDNHKRNDWCDGEDTPFSKRATGHCKHFVKVDRSVCHMGVAWLKSVRGHGCTDEGCSSVSIGDCTYRYHAQYACEDDFKRSMAHKVKAETLFCFHQLMAHGHEADVARAQQKHKLGIWQCEERALFSTEDLDIPGIKTHIVPSTNIKTHCHQPRGEKMVCAHIFLHMWETVVHKGLYKHTRWSLKIDPDTVFIAGRFRVQVVAAKTRYGPDFDRDSRRGMYVSNCLHRSGTEMWGYLEVISLEGMHRMKENMHRLKEGEDHRSLRKVAEDDWVEWMCGHLKLAELFIDAGCKDAESEPPFNRGYVAAVEVETPGEYLHTWRTEGGNLWHKP